RAIALTEANIGASIGGAVAALGVGLWQQSGVGWRAAVVVALAIPALAAWRYHTLALDAPRAATGARTGHSGALPWLFWVLWLITLLLGAAEWSTTYWGAEYLYKPIGFDRSVAAALMSAFLIAMVFGRAVGSRLVRVMPTMPLLALATLLSLGGFLVFWQ